MLNPQKTRGREAMLRRIRELDAEIAQHERNMGEGEARLPIEEQLSLKLRRFIEANIPELAAKVRVEIGASEESKLNCPVVEALRCRNSRSKKCGVHKLPFMAYPLR